MSKVGDSELPGSEPLAIAGSSKLPVALPEPLETKNVANSRELIYKSSSELPVQAESQIRLARWDRDGHARRQLYIGPSIVELLHRTPQPTMFSRVDLVRFLDNFSQGRTVSVSMDPRQKDAELKPLKEANLSWSVKVQRPRPGWRFIGKFASKDCLILLVHEDREKLANDWRSLLQECDDLWKQISSQPACQGAVANDYLSEPYYECPRGF